MNTDAGLMQLMTMADWVSQFAPLTEEEKAMKEELWRTVLEHVHEDGENHLNNPEPTDSSNINDETPPERVQSSGPRPRFSPQYYAECRPGDEDGGSEVAERVYMTTEDRHPYASDLATWKEDDTCPTVGYFKWPIIDGVGRCVPHYLRDPTLEELEHRVSYFKQEDDGNGHINFKPMVIFIWIDYGEDDDMVTLYCRMFHETDGRTNWKVAYPINTETHERSSSPAWEEEVAPDNSQQDDDKVDEDEADEAELDESGQDEA